MPRRKHTADTKLPLRREKGIRRTREDRRMERAERRRRKDAERLKAMNPKQLRDQTRVPRADNDIAWAGMLQRALPFWIKRTSTVAQAAAAISALCMIAIMVSVFFRHPPLLIGVYPDGTEVCFPHLTDRNARPVPRDPVYDAMCHSMAVRAGASWYLKDPDAVTQESAVKSEKPLPKRLTPAQAMKIMNVKPVKERRS